MAERAFGIDVSAWQDLVYWDLIATHEEEVVFAGIRATISWGYQEVLMPSRAFIDSDTTDRAKQ